MTEAGATTETGATTSAAAPVLLVTGASRGIGRAIAASGAALGYSVAVHYRANAEAARESAALCEARRLRPEQRFFPIAADLADPAARASLIPLVLERAGRLDALVNNAGMAPRRRADITAMPEDSFREVLETNLLAPFFLAQQAAALWLDAPQAPAQPRRHIIFIGSISAETVSLNRGEYCIAKAGLAMAGRLWARRLAPHGIGVVELRPGIIDTDMTAAVRERYDAVVHGAAVPQRRWGTPDDVARAVEAVLEGKLDFSAGSVIHLDGGMHIAEL